MNPSDKQDSASSVDTSASTESSASQGLQNGLTEMEGYNILYLTLPPTMGGTPGKKTPIYQISDTSKSSTSFAEKASSSRSCTKIER